MDDPLYTPLPPDEGNARLMRLFDDLRFGVLNGKWKNLFYIAGIPAWRNQKLNVSQNIQLEEYLSKVWDNETPEIDLLIDMGLLEEIPNSASGEDTAAFKLTTKGLEGR